MRRNTAGMIDAQTQGLLFIVAVFGGIIVVPVGLVIAFVLLRARMNRARLREPWGALAQKIGGQLREGSGFSGSSIVAPRPTHSVQVRMKVVSAMEASSGPYYSDGGTYTEILSELSWQHSALFVAPNVNTQTFRDRTRVPTLQALGPEAAIYVDPKVARIVVPGVVDDVNKLEASARALEELTWMVLQNGPLPTAA